MITDNNLRLSGSLTAAAAAFSGGVPSGSPAGQTITSSGSNLSTNTIDLSVLRDIGFGKDLYVVWTVTTAFTRAAGALTATFKILNDDDAALGSPVVLAATDAIAKASLVVGYKIALRIPPQLKSLGLRYLGADVVLSAAGDTGAACCDIVETLDDSIKAYASGITVV